MDVPFTGVDNSNDTSHPNLLPILVVRNDLAALFVCHYDVPEKAAVERDRSMHQQREALVMVNV